MGQEAGGRQPGACARQLGILLRASCEGFDLARLKPDKGVVNGGAGETSASSPSRASSTPIYFDGGNCAELQVELPAGDYAAEWIDTRTGAKARAEDVSGGGRPDAEVARVCRGHRPADPQEGTRRPRPGVVHDELCRASNPPVAGSHGQDRGHTEAWACDVLSRSPSSH